MLWFQIPPATLVMGSNPTSCNHFAGLFCYFWGTFGCDTGMKLPDHIKPMTGFQIGNSVLLPEGPAGLGPAQKMRKTRPWLLSDVNTVFFFGLARSSPNKASYWLFCIFCIFFFNNSVGFNVRANIMAPSCLPRRDESNDIWVDLERSIRDLDLRSRSRIDLWR